MFLRTGFWIWVGVTVLSSVLPVDGQSCHNRFNIDFYTLDNFTNHMCLDCLDLLILPESNMIWKNYSKVIDWKINIFTFGNVIQMADMNYTLRYDQLKKHTQNPEGDVILRELANDYYRQNLVKCCQDAFECCRSMQSVNAMHKNLNLCPMKWDGWSCWDQAQPETVSYQKCPDMSVFLLGSLPPKCVRSSASKICQANGKWVERTQYGQCSIQAKSNRLALVYTMIAFEVVSLFFTIIGLFLFIYYRLYRKFRVQLHINFFTSIILSSLMTILYNILITKAHIDHSNDYIYVSPTLCKLFTVLFKEIRLFNYSWMLIEGIFFHQIVVFTFNEMSKHKNPIFFVGWISPNVVILVYTVLRANYGNDKCWTSLMGNYEWVFLCVPYFCFITNFILFANLIRVIVNKLILTKSFYPHFAKQGIKTSLVLLPVFGLQYIMHFVPVDPTETCDNFAVSLEYLQVIVEGLQGTIVTTILCFMDKDVYTCIRKSFGRRDSSSAATSAHMLTEKSRSNAS